LDIVGFFGFGWFFWTWMALLNLDDSSGLGWFFWIWMILQDLDGSSGLGWFLRT
jgi:hypothetical protein